mmetsp:Transcript_33391/g.54521  ORF Transcript_33391/g.54521 Transcript_33391/m.54521 type:complete len:85 (-) Transcript_33391:363-617(-)
MCLLFAKMMPTQPPNVDHSLRTVGCCVPFLGVSMGVLGLGRPLYHSATDIIFFVYMLLSPKPTHRTRELWRFGAHNVDDWRMLG